MPRAGIVGGHASRVAVAVWHSGAAETWLRTAGYKRGYTGAKHEPLGTSMDGWSARALQAGNVQCLSGASWKHGAK